MAKLRIETAAESDALAAWSVDVGGAVAYIRNFAVSWEKAQPRTRAALIQSVYAEIVVRGEQFVSVRLTPEAYAHGLAVALPEAVEVPVLPSRGGHGKTWYWRARRCPTGVGRADATIIVRVPIAARTW